MGASPLMSLGVKAMSANYAALQTTGHNIANANVAGYSRQRAELATSLSQYTGSGWFGRGVDVASVTRAYDQFLTREAGNASALASQDATRHTQLQRLETYFKPGENGLGQATTELMNALVDLSSHSADSATRRVVLARASDLAARFAEAGAGLDAVQGGVWSDLRSAAAEVNALSRGIAQANQRIAEVIGRGQPPNDLLDERDRLVDRLSTHLQVTRMEAADGSLSIFVAGGQSLVLGTRHNELSVLQDPSDPTRAVLGRSEGGVQRLLREADMGGGGIAGLLRFQNEDLVRARTLLGQMAAAVGGAVNQQQMLGLNLMPPAGSVPSSAMFALGEPQALANANNARDADGLPLAAVTLSITDPAALQASEYDLRQDPAGGGWQLTRRLDGLVTPISDGDVVDGMRIGFSGNAQPGDRFLLQPVTRAANGMQALLADPRELAAAASVLASTSPANTGTALVGAVQQHSAPADGATVNISFVSDAGDYSWEMLDADGGLIGLGGGRWQAGNGLPPPGETINGFALQISGVPRTGDVITVAPTPPGALSMNNGNALSLMALRDAPLSDGRTATDTWALALAEVGVRVQSARTASEISASVALVSNSNRSAQTGVNLDEEAARLIQYQQSYQAAAKVLQVAQTLFDTLLSVAGR